MCRVLAHAACGLEYARCAVRRPPHARAGALTMPETSRRGRPRVAPAGLSVCCLTADRPAMVAAMLGMFRPVADDIVVAVDSRVEPRQLAPLLDVADTVVRFEYSDPPERSRPWLLSLCRNDVVLSVDGDEVPSAALLTALPALAADDDVVQTRIARRWCFPDERYWLAERPWWPDFQHRLVRRGPLLDFDVSVHGGVRPALPARYVEEPLYHLACVLRDVADRRRRARVYEAQRPGMVAVGGGPMNETLYVPEHFATRRPEPTAEVDRAAMRSRHGGRGPLLRRRGRTSRSSLPAEIAAHLPEDPLEAQGYRARLRIVERDLRTDPGNDTLLVAEVVNLGDAPIPRDDARRGAGAHRRPRPRCRARGS